jgi:hypothetical protein
MAETVTHCRSLVTEIDNPIPAEQLSERAWAIDEFVSSKLHPDYVFHLSAISRESRGLALNTPSSHVVRPSAGTHGTVNIIASETIWLSLASPGPQVFAWESKQHSGI